MRDPIKANLFVKQHTDYIGDIPPDYPDYYNKSRNTNEDGEFEYADMEAWAGPVKDYDAHAVIAELESRFGDCIVPDSYDIEKRDMGMSPGHVSYEAVVHFLIQDYVRFREICPEMLVRFVGDPEFDGDGYYLYSHDFDY